MFPKRILIIATILLLSLGLTTLAFGSSEQIEDQASKQGLLLPEDPSEPDYPQAPQRQVSVPPNTGNSASSVQAPPMLAAELSQIAELQVEEVFARVNTTWDAVDGWFGSGVSVWFTVTGADGNPKGDGGGTTRPDGWLDGVGCNCDIVPGDQVRVQSSAGFDEVLVPIPITGHIDPLSDQVSGQMSGGIFPASGGVGAHSEGRQEDSWVDISILGDGSYLADFSGLFDFQTGDQAEVWYFDANGNHLGTTIYALQIQVNYAHDWVYAWTEPNAVVTFEVAGKATLLGFADDRGEFRGWEWNDAWSPSVPDIAPGDVVTAEAAGFTSQIDPVGTITGDLDLDLNIVSGEVFAEWFDQPLLRLRCEAWVENGPSIEAMVDPNGGSYTCDFGSLGFDIQVGQDISVRYYEPDSDQVINVFKGPYARVNITWDNVDGWFGPGANVWYTVTDASGTLIKGGGEGTVRPDGWLDSVGCGCDIVPGDQVHVWSDAGFDEVLVPIAITGHIDPLTNQVYGQMSGGAFPASGGVWAWSDGRQLGSWLDMSIGEDGSYSADFNGKFDLETGDSAEVWYFDANGNQLGIILYTLQIQVNYAHDWVYAWTEPNAEVTFEVAGKAALVGSADDRGEFRGWEWNGAWTPSPPDITPGDVVTAEAAGFTSQIDPVGTITGDLDLDKNIVSGVVQADWFTQSLRLRCEAWVENGPSIEAMVDPNGGSYTCDFGSLGFDIQVGQDISVRYFEPDSDQVINVFKIPRLDLRVNYGDDWVESFYEAGHTILITVTESDGVTVKATAEVFTEPREEWGGQPGFQTRPEDWYPSPPDIQPYDWVYGQVDTGQSAQVQIGDISGMIDLATDSIQGVIAAPWFSGEVDVECHPWGAPNPNTPMKDDRVLPSGFEPYACAWDPETEWDILAGETVGVGYFGLDKHWVANAFRIPAPYLQIWTWGDQSPAAGGNFAFNINYQNTGEGDAPETTIKAVLSENVTYLSDTSGLPRTGSGTEAEPLVWQVEDLAPARFGTQFMVFVQVNGASGESMGIEVEIGTPLPYNQDPSSKQSQWSATILENDTHLNISKGAWTWDPVPGGEFVYNVNVCNNGPTASSEVVLTDTLSEYTTLLYWWGQHAGWEEVIFEDHLLVVKRPTIPGYFCSEVYLRVRLDESAGGMDIVNTAEVASTSDLETEDNQTTIRHGTGSPHTNLGLNKNWRYGQMVPGGEIRYEIDYYNSGNVPVEDVWFTGTLPEGVEFVELWEYDWQVQNVREVHPIIEDGTIRWEQGTLDNGYRGGYQLAVRVDPQAQPGDSLDLTLAISSQQAEYNLWDEDNPWDNAVSYHDVLNDFGPNLQVDKQNFYWEGMDRIWYEIRVKNLGSEWLENILITDILPNSTTFDGWWVNHGPEISATPDPINQQVVFWVSALEPGGTASIGLYARLDESVVGLQGLAYTNSIAAPIPGDIVPEDNYDQSIAYTGPDLYVEKWIVEGEPKPGGTLTFLVRLGNQNRWPWEVSEGAAVELMERLPRGMSFVRAYWPNGDPFEPQRYNPRSGILTFDMGRWGAPDLRWFYLVVKLEDNVKPGKVLRNQVLVREQPEIDIDPLPDNNVLLYLLEILSP